MSTTYFSWTFPSPDCDSLSPDEALQQMGEPVAEGRTLSSASRNNWLADNLARAAACLQISGLEFITSLDGIPQNDRSGTRWIVSCLEKTEVETARAGTESFLNFAADRPGDLGGALNPAISSEEILCALDSLSVPSVSPVGEEEGDGPLYLFAYLKGLRSLLDYAQEHGLCVIHTRHVH